MNTQEILNFHRHIMYPYMAVPCVFQMLNEDETAELKK